jgi:hypothetical protein
MKQRRLRRSLISLLILFLLSGSVLAQSPLALKDVFEKNILAAGGKDKLLQIKNISFKSAATRYFAAPSGELKMTTGKDPVVTEVILVKGDNVQRNSLNVISDLTGIRKAAHQVLAKLYAGLFTLQKFEKELVFNGLKTFGPEKLYHLTTKSDPLKVDLFVRADDFHLKRLVFQGATPEGDKYEVNYDFAPFEEVEGLKIPLSWFSSQVGTRGTLIEISEVKFNQPLAADFFAKTDVNAGAVAAAPGRLKGNVLDFNAAPNGLTIVTNWTKADIEKAGLKSGDKLTLTSDTPRRTGFTASVVFYAAANEMPPQSELAKGARILSPAPRGGETYVLQFVAMDMSSLASTLQLLDPIEIERK